MKIVPQIMTIFLLGLGICVSATSALAEFGTLFTTASERKTINDNRYIIKKRTGKVTTVAKIEVEKIEEVIYKTIKKEYKISGISIANNGLDSAWINGKSYENGESLNKKISISIKPIKRQVRFTVRGGKTFYGQSGDTVTVSYNVPILE